MKDRRHAGDVPGDPPDRVGLQCLDVNHLDPFVADDPDEIEERPWILLLSSEKVPSLCRMTPTLRSH